MRIGGDSSSRMMPSRWSATPGDRQRRDRRRVGAQRLDLDLQAGVRRREHAVAAALEAGDPVLPAARGHPQPVDQDDGGCARVVDGHRCFLSRWPVSPHRFCTMASRSASGRPVLPRRARRRARSVSPADDYPAPAGDATRGFSSYVWDGDPFGGDHLGRRAHRRRQARTRNQAPAPRAQSRPRATVRLATWPTTATVSPGWVRAICWKAAVTRATT